METLIALTVLDRYKKNNNIHIPDRIVRGPFLHCSCDNIDVLDETLDGKNTFHCTQMVVWQKSDMSLIVNDTATVQKLRERTIKANELSAFQTLSKSSVKKTERPKPAFHENTKFEPEDWLDKQSASTDKHATDSAWLSSRMMDKDSIIPGWKEFNTQGDSMKTNVGFFSILQTNPDSYESMTTVIDRFVDISKSLGHE